MTRPNVTVAFPFPFHKVTAAFFSPSSVPDDFSNRPCVPPLLPLTTAVGVEREEGRGKNLGKCCSPNNSRAQHSTLLLSPPILRPHTFTMFYSFSFTYFSLIFSILIFNHKLKYHLRNVYIYGHLFLWQHSALFIILTIQSHGGIYLRALEEYTQVNKCARGGGTSFFNHTYVHKVHGSHICLYPSPRSSLSFVLGGEGWLNYACFYLTMYDTQTPTTD